MTRTTHISSIRPYRLFTILQDAPAHRIAQIQIPPRRAGGSLTLLETMLLITAARVVKAEKAFEFGTFLGSTTLNLALNVAGEVTTLDLEKALETQHADDAPLTAMHFQAAALDFEGSPAADRIRTLAGNSVTFDFTPFRRSFDLVFIDGGHDRETVESDTRNAFDLVRLDKPSCVLWHDYRNAIYPELTEYLDELSAERELVHLEDTMLCAWFHQIAL